MTTVYVGDHSKEFAEKIKRIDSTARLVNSENYKDWTSFNCMYTSVADLDEFTFVDLCTQVDRVVYDRDYGSRLPFTNDLMLLVASKRDIDNFSPVKKCSDYLHLEDSRKTESPQLWCAGCSYTLGVGVNENQRYPSLLAESLNMPMSLLARSGSSITWAADQILRSDIRSNDIVVWGLTEHYRIPYWQGKEFHIVANSAMGLPFNMTRIVEEDVVCRNIRAINQTINYCEKIGAKLYLAGLLDSSEHTNHLFDRRRHYIHLQRKNLDLGTDGLHPGPIEHQRYANLIFEKIKETI